MHGGARNFRALEDFQQSRSAIPGQIFAASDDHVALQRGHRQRVDPVEIEIAHEAIEGRSDVVENLLGIIDEVHLVHRQYDVRNAQQAGDIGVAARLRQQTFARIHQHDRQVCSRGPGHHVARVLLVSRRIGDDELARRRGEIAIRHIDGDALLAFGQQPVGQQR